MESSAVNVSSEVKVTVTLVLNASFSWLEEPSNNILTSYLASFISLGLLALTAVLLNLCVILAVFCGGSLKKVPLNQLISHMSLSCVLDCVLNVPFSMYYLKTNAWMLGITLCTLNAATVIFVTLLIAWILCYMCIERYFSLHKVCQSKRCSLFCKQHVAMVTIAIIICCVVFPVAAGIIEVRAFPSRYSCYIATNNELCYQIVITVGFCIPIIISSICLFFAYNKKLQGMREISSRGMDMSYTELFFEESQLWNEWQTSKFVSIIFLLFFILEFPSIITFMKPTNISLNRTEINNIQQRNTTVHVTYPIAEITSPIERAYFWCKYIFCLLFPLVSLTLRKDIRKKVSIIMSLCRANSSITKNSINSPVPQEECSDDFLVPQTWRRRRLSSVSNLKSPIIFGKCRSGSIQFMDLTTGIAKWKANYDEPKCNKVEKPFFADIFDDEDELTEFVCYQDLTEEEINSSELTAIPSTSRNVSVQTAQNQLLKPSAPEPCYNISDPKEQFRSIYDGRVNKGRSRKSRRLSKSFTCSRVSNNYEKHKYYMTFPKMAQSSNLSTDSSTSDLLRALEIKRSSKSGMTACDLIPRGTAELLDSPVESRDIVSL